MANFLGFKFIAGFAESGAPFGIEMDEDETDSTNEIMDTDEVTIKNSWKKIKG